MLASNIESASTTCLRTLLYTYPYEYNVAKPSFITKSKK